VNHDFLPLSEEIAWMSLYFSAAVRTSLFLTDFGLMEHILLRHCCMRAPARRDAPLVPIRIRSLHLVP
jgi:hypothetical protein